MSDPPKNPPPRSGCLAPLTFWLGLPALMLASKVLEDAAPGYGKLLFLGTLGSGLVAVVLYLLIGRTVKETSSNVASVVKWFAILVVASFVVGGLFRCDGNTTSDIYYRK